MQRVLSYLLNMFPYMLIALPIILLARLPLCRLMKNSGKRTTVWHEVGVCLFFLFLVGLASQTVIPKIDFTVGGAMTIQRSAKGSVNLFPGMVFADLWKEVVIRGDWQFFVINVLGNILFFCPIGFCLPLLWERFSFGKTLCLALGLSLCIELCQLPQARGVDVDDLWLNTAGAAVGYLCYFGLGKKLKSIFIKFKITKIGPPNA